MRKIVSILISPRLMAGVLLVFAISIAVATFIESHYNSETARVLVYNSLWFESLLFLGVINLTGTIFMNKLYRKEKLSIFIFHLAFILIIIGAAVTRFCGFEGYMHIREGESSNAVISDRSYLIFQAFDKKEQIIKEKPIYVSSVSDNAQEFNYTISGEKLKLEILKVIPNAEETVYSGVDGKPTIEIVFADKNGRKTIYLAEKETIKVGDLKFGFNCLSNDSVVNFTYNGTDLNIYSPKPPVAMDMVSQNRDTLESEKSIPMQFRKLYVIGSVQLVVRNYFQSAKIGIVPANEGRETGEYGLIARLTYKKKSTTKEFLMNSKLLNVPQHFLLDNLKAFISFGPKQINLPFSLALHNFILERYPGSNSPSWFESKVMLYDPENNIKEGYRIFMNNVLKYRGYRFYQTSYDQDEKGTVLSVNKDFWGTLITYIGYSLLLMGIIISLFNKNSRFRKLSASLSQKAAIALALLFALVGSASSQVIDKAEAAKFGELLIQDEGGRVKPVNTLSSEVFRKVYRQTEYENQTSDQIILGMMVFPEHWQHVPIIKIGHEEIRKKLGIKDNYATFNDFIRIDSSKTVYVLEEYVQEAYQKKPASRSKFDNEIIRLDERVNLCYLVYSGQFLRIFPHPKDSLAPWAMPANVGQNLSGNDSAMFSSIIPVYFQLLRSEKKDTLFNEILSSLKKYQQQYGKGIVPSESKIKTEIWYNRLLIFERIASFYGLLGFILLILQFITVFNPQRTSIKFKKVVYGLILLCFAGHVVGLIFRWYISGHAPWSNAYESMLYIAFATMLAGIIFSRKSVFALSLSAILAWLILFVAHLNWMDPEIGHLVPVLKSYWLLIHVAIITASYGFLAIGAIMAFVNLCMMAFQNKQHESSIKLNITEMTTIIEMTLIIGLYMLTIGTFLGGVWANESWGRYWAWDPKETWALVSVLVYAFVAHMRFIPGLKSVFIFNLMALLAFSSIIMTYFGVNYYLTGLHSYGKGDPVPVPEFVYYTLAVIAVISTLAWHKQSKPINE